LAVGWYYISKSLAAECKNTSASTFPPALYFAINNKGLIPGFSVRVLNTRESSSLSGMFSFCWGGFTVNKPRSWGWGSRIRLSTPDWCKSEVMKWVGMVLNGSAAMDVEDDRIESRWGCNVAVIVVVVVDKGSSEVCATRRSIKHLLKGEKT
jgi:hypothetical protein